MQNETQETPRSSARFSVKLTVQLYPSRVGSTREDNQSINFEGTIQNISNGGACIETSSPLSISEVLKIAFPIQSAISSFISTPRTLAEVKWTHPVPGDKFISGLRFLL